MTEEKIRLPLIKLPELVLFPKAVHNLDISEPKAIAAIDSAMDSNSDIFAATQKKEADSAETENIYRFGVIAKVKQILRLPGNILRIVLVGVKRGLIESFDQTEPFLSVSAISFEEISADSKTLEIAALIRIAKDAFNNYASMTGRFSDEFLREVANCDEAGEVADLIIAHLQIRTDDKQALLEEINPLERIGSAIKYVYYETQITAIQRDIYQKVKTNIDKNQKDFYLREQMKVIKEELGDKDGVTSEVSAYRERMKESNLPDYVLEKLETELKRLERSQTFSAETTVIRDYIDWVLDLNWSKPQKPKINLKRSAEILDRDHYGLEKVKERIIEYLAVKQNSDKLDAPILCLVGSPGVGKTSIAKSVAECLKLKYVRMSLGGVRDEAEIRGHRKTYVGAMPGRIISSLKQAGTSNPLILLDEIDKMSSDFRGNPAAALLEVLDSEQNITFRDNYLEIPYDLSEVLFMCTANSMEGVPPALIDRLEIINISGYTPEEKFRIAVSYLMPNQYEKHGLKKPQLRIANETVEHLIRYYTKEAGVRQLERLIGDLCRKAVKEMRINGAKSVKINAANLEKYLGKRKYRHDEKNETAEIGIAKGLAWTSLGGEILNIEVNTMKGSGKFELTGNMGNVMKESAQAAISYIRSKSNELAIDDNFHLDTDIHIHIPEGATPKDGPSAGITMAAAMTSALIGVPVKNSIGMTGEITIRGRVLPIGGLKEKVIAARDGGLTEIILPDANRSDYSELPEYIKSGLNFIFVKTMNEVLDNALLRPEI